MLGFALAGNHLHIARDILNGLILFGECGIDFANTLTRATRTLAGATQQAGHIGGLFAAVRHGHLATGNGQMHRFAGGTQPCSQRVNLASR